MRAANLLSPASAARVSAAKRSGATLADAEIVPTPPQLMMGQMSESSPDMTRKPFGTKANKSSTASRDPVESLAPIAMPSLARRAIVGGAMPTPQRPGIVYAMIGNLVA